MSNLLLVHDDQTITLRGEKFRIYLDRSTIQARVRELGEAISRDYQGKKPILIGVLNGAFMFLADLMREIRIDCEVDFLKLSSYGAEKITSGVVRELKKIDAEIEGRHILIVEDIIDTGQSMEFIIKRIRDHAPASVKTVTLLHKFEATQVEVPINYVGFPIRNLFVVGYGLDYGQLGRNLPEIYILEESIGGADDEPGR